jgi:predicted NUDIX family phosphoesterase
VGSSTKSALQLRAEAAAERFHTEARSAIVIEFAGVPKAGKTTTLNHVQAFLRRCGFRVNVVVERASVCPIKDKKDSNFNIWTACTTLVQVLDKTQTPPSVDDPEILILDRGIFDSIWWFTLMEDLARIRKEDRLLVESFLLADEWRKRISGVVVMTTTASDALLREKGPLPVEGAQGSIMNPHVLEKTRELVQAAADRLIGKFRIRVVDTSSAEFGNNTRDTCAAVASQVLDWVEEQIEERIFSVEKSEVSRLFGSNVVLSETQTRDLESVFKEKGSYVARSNIENDLSRVQALPIVVVRNKSGSILRLIRKETDARNELHEKVVLWAGGHVRQEDADEGDSLKGCAVREMQEELRLRITPESLTRLGSVYIDNAGNTSKHVAFVYEWRAETDYVSVSLNNSEFFERGGKSLRCEFVEKDALQGDAADGRISEIWSKTVLDSLLVD